MTVQQQPAQSESIEVFARRLQIAKERWAKLPEEKRQEYIRKAGVMNKVLFRSNKLGDRERQNLLGMVDLPKSTYHDYRVRCERMKRLFPGENLALAFVKGSGRPKVELFTEEQELLIVGAYVFDDWEVIYPNEPDNPKKSRYRAKADFIYNLFHYAYPESSITPRQIERFLHDGEKESHVLFKLGREGLRALWKDYVPKLPNNVPCKFYRLQSDACSLPVVYNATDGKKTWKSTAALVIIIDDFDLEILAWGLVPKVIPSEINPDELRRTDFTNDHVRLLLASVMLEYKFRPRFWYTDHGSQFVKIDPFILWLTEGYDEDAQIITLKGYVGHPWSRGKVEVVQKIIQQALSKSKGFVRNEKDRMEWRRAMRETDVTFENLEAAVAEFVKTWNESIRAKAIATDSSTTAPLPMLEIERIAYFAGASAWNSAKFDDTGLTISGKKYRPKQLKTPEDTARFMNAVGKEVRYCIIPVNKTQNLYLASLDGKHIEEMIVASEAPPSGRRRTKNQQGAIDNFVGSLEEKRTQFVELCLRLFSGVPQTNIIGNQPVFPQPPAAQSGQPETPPNQAGSNTTPPATGNTQTQTGSRRTTRPQTSPPPISDDFARRSAEALALLERDNIETN